MQRPNLYLSLFFILLLVIWLLYVFIFGAPISFVSLPETHHPIIQLLYMIPILIFNILMNYLLGLVLIISAFIFYLRYKCKTLRQLLSRKNKN